MKAGRHAEEPEQRKALQRPHQTHLLEFDGQRDGIEEDVDLEDAEEEEAEMFKHFGKEIPEEADVGGQVRNGEAAGKPAGNIHHTGEKPSLKPFTPPPPHSHEAVDGRHVVPGAQQEEGQADQDKQAAQVHEEVLNHKPPEADAPEVDRDVLTLQEQTQGDGSQRPGERRDAPVTGRRRTCIR